MTSRSHLDHSRRLHLVQSEEALSDLLLALRGVQRVGVDTEANSFHAYHERVCLIQISTEEADWVVDPLAVHPEPLGSFFSDERTEVVFHAGEFDVLSLKRDFSFRFASIFDTQIAAMLLGMGQAGYASLVEQFFGVRLPKGQQRSDWGRRPLTSRQMDYAVADTRYLLPLRARLGAMLEEQGRLVEARAGFARLAASEPRPRVFDPEGYRKIKGFRDLDPTGRSIVRALYLARETRAKRLNKPPFRVLGNDAIMGIATLRPRDRTALSKVKGVPETTIQRFGDQLLEAVTRGLKDRTPPPLKRGGPRGSGGRSGKELGSVATKRFERLRAWRNRMAAEKGIAGHMVLRNEVLRLIASESPRTIAELRGILGKDDILVSSYGQGILDVLDEGAP